MDSLIIPEGFDIREILKGKGVPSISIYAHVDKYNYLLHHLITKQKFNKLKKNEWVNTNYKLLEKLFGPKYTKEIIVHLIELKVIESDNKFLIGEKSTGYRLTSAYRDKQLTSVPLTNKILKSKLKDENKNRLNDLNGLHAFLLFHLKELGIQKDDAYDFIQRNLKENADAHKFMVDCISDGFQYFTADNQNRIHTNLTGLKRELRQFLFHRLNPTQALVQLDLMNSQPFFLACIINKEYQKAGGVMEPDITLFLNLCCTGTLYEYLMPFDNTLSRTQIKDKVFVAMYSANNQVSKFTNYFKTIFPNVHKFISEAKKWGHGNLARDMQKEESLIMITKIGKRIEHEFKHNLWYCTIHDCIVTTENNLDIVYNIIMEEIETHHQLKPQIEVKRLN